MMSQINLQNIFPVGGVVKQDINIIEVKPTAKEGVLVGKAILPLTNAEQKIVIYQVKLESGSEDIRAVSASCPHQGADISRDELKADGNVYCSLHKRPICIYSKFNQAYAVTKRNEQYVILASE